MSSTDTSRSREALGIASGGTSKTSDKDVVLQVRTQQLDRLVPQLARAVPHGVEADQIARDVLTALRTNDDLWKCTEASLWGGAMTAAQVGLRVGVLGHGWLIPFKNRYLSERAGREVWEAQWVLGYQGMIELAHRTDKILNVNAHTIFSKEPYKILYGAEERVEHQPIFGGDRGEPIIYYAQLWLSNGGYSFFPMDRPRMQEFAERLPSWRNRSSPWHTAFEPMAWKTCLRRLFRYAPKTAALALAVEADEQVAKLEGDQLVREDRMTALPAAPEDPAGTTPNPDREQIVVTDPPQSASTDQAEAAEPVTGPKARRKQPDSRARQALLAALTEKHGDDRAVATVLVRHVLHGEAVPIEQVTTEELRAALAWDPLLTEPPAEPTDPDPDGPAIDAAYEADMAEHQNTDLPSDGADQ